VPGSLVGVRLDRPLEHVLTLHDPYGLVVAHDREHGASRDVTAFGVR
jgi:hypothetical protein